MSHQLELLTENPSHWTALSCVTPEIQKREIKPFVLLALKELQNVPDSRTSSLVNADKFSAVREVVRHVARLRSATKVPWLGEDLRTFLEGLRFSPECVTELATLLCTDQIYADIPKHLRFKPGLASLRWKIDVSLSQSSIAAEQPCERRVRELMHRDTRVILLMELADGRSVAYRLTVGQFHTLRYTIASALKSMIVLEKRKCMRRDRD